MADYTPPAGNDVDFSFDGGYSAPSGDGVNFLFGTVAEVVSEASMEVVYDEAGLSSVIIRWTSTETGDYKIEMGGTGVTTGDLLASGHCIADMEMENVLTATAIKAATSYTGDGSYRFNIYVKSSDEIWTPYE